LTLRIFASEWLQKLAPSLSGFNQFKNAIQPVRDFIRDQITEHLSTYQDDTTRDFIDLYIKKIKATTDPKSTFYGIAGGFYTKISIRCEKHVVKLSLICVETVNILCAFVLL